MALHLSTPLTYPMVVSNKSGREELLTLGCAARFLATNVPPRTHDGEVLSVVTAIVQAARRAKADDILLVCFALEDLLTKRGYDVEKVLRDDSPGPDADMEERGIRGWISPLVSNIASRLTSLGGR